MNKGGSFYKSPVLCAFHAVVLLPAIQMKLLTGEHVESKALIYQSV